jgi:E3 ubiquitin-protein ligase FANCL
MSTSLHQRVVRDFPHVAADDADLLGFSGFLHCRNATYRVRVTPSGGVCGDAALRAVLDAAPPAARRRIAAAPDAHAKLVELRDVVERAEEGAGGGSRGAGAGVDLPPAAFYESLLQELGAIGWEHVAGMDEAMRSVQLRVLDGGSREHTVSVTLPLDYPSAAPCVAGALPEQFRLTSWRRGSSTLSTVLAQFSDAVARFQCLFDALDDIDGNCWVLEPERPLRSDVYRRIAIGKHSSLRIELDPRAPTRAVPECRFLGSEAAVGPLRALLNENMRAWVTSGHVSPRANLEAVLGVTLPPRPAQLAGGLLEDMGLECGICYAYRLEDRVPEVACDRVECARPYHRGCLVEWLRALPDTRQSFDTLFGTCPYCEHHISVSAADT